MFYFLLFSKKEVLIIRQELLMRVYCFASTERFSLMNSRGLLFHFWIEVEWTVGAIVTSKNSTKIYLPITYFG